MTANGYKVSFGDDENILKLDLVMIAQLSILKMMYTLNGWTLWYVNYIAIKLSQKMNRALGIYGILLSGMWAPWKGGLGNRRNNG